MTAIVWFRRDLRLHDHAALHAAMLTGDPIIPVYIVEDSLCRSATIGDKRLHAHFAAIAALDDTLAQLGGRLLIRHGKPTASALSISGRDGCK
jgi:deoxyribodipyrimidine photo-lyase